MNYGGFNSEAVLFLLEKFGFILFLLGLTFYGLFGTALTLKNIKAKANNAFPVTIKNIKLKNEEALSYLGTYVIPLLIQGEMGLFEYITFLVLFTLYYKLFSSSSLILINPILNLKYGLYEIDYLQGSEKDKTKNALVISSNKWVEEDTTIKILKLSHRLYFAY